MGRDLCSFNTAAGSLSSDSNLPQLHDRYGGSDDNEEDDKDESGYGADSYDDMLSTTSKKWAWSRQSCVDTRLYIAMLVSG